MARLALATLPKRKKAGAAGAPAWIVTFADLATLLLTFFILLLSFAEMDIEKYKAMAGSLSVAFGSGNLIADGGGSLPIKISDGNSSLDPDTQLQAEPELIDERSTSGSVTLVSEGEALMSEGVITLASSLIRELETEVAGGALSVDYDEHQVIIRFSEDSTFLSGDATIKKEMLPIIERVVNVLKNCRGDVVVAGYTDDRPIASSRYRSNWDLSAARAVSVVHELVLNRDVPADRVIAAGRAETNPLVPNNSPENRAVNRRVEIAIRGPVCEDDAPIEQLPAEVIP
ncbi:flagellar motor protein MotB [Marinobacter psychrophilus]|uniref:flagellar motor protein MotB n=1 Tax=Marinobacter psychrophilus TaxID=330734 RepID=UPI001B4AD098|nr:flagellar motor protein MotB [Marinobacter psychrophilus]MBQ0762110.1 OmpA family protein [Marinobacter psychrophilus]MBQ0843684.1 OmpA family protein [Marinobacter psychrophilus]